jgi:2-phosphoglycerate kinase
MVAKHLSKELGIPWVSTDTLENVIVRYVPEDKHDVLFPKNAMRKKTQQSNDLMYTTYSAQNIANAYLKQGEAVWEAVEAFLDGETIYGHEYILEGHHLHPVFVKKLSEKYSARSIFLGRNDIEKTRAAITDNPSSNDWVLKKTKNKDIIVKIAEMLTIFDAHIKAEAKASSFKYLAMDHDFNAAVREAVEYLKSTPS